MHRTWQGPPLDFARVLVHSVLKECAVWGPARRIPAGFLGDRSMAAGDEQLISETMYGEIHRLAERAFASERTGHTLQPTAIVNEACMRLMSGGLPAIPREEQLAIAGRVLKQVLIDHARKRDADKRGGGAARVELDQEIMGPQITLVEFDRIHAALDKLRALSERQAEVVTLRMFGGRTLEQVGTVLGITRDAAEGDWRVAKAWLRRELERSLGGRGS